MPPRKMKKLPEVSFDSVIADFEGPVHQLEGAIGAYIVGQAVGYRPLLVAHDRKTIRKWEAILGFRYRDVLPPENDGSVRMQGYVNALNESNFWKVVKGETKVNDRGIMTR